MKNQIYIFLFVTAGVLGLAACSSVLVKGGRGPASQPVIEGEWHGSAWFRWHSNEFYRREFSCARMVAKVARTSASCEGSSSPAYSMTMTCQDEYLSSYGQALFAQNIQVCPSTQTKWMMEETGAKDSGRTLRFSVEPFAHDPSRKALRGVKMITVPGVDETLMEFNFPNYK